MDILYIFAAVSFFIWSIRSIFNLVNHWQQLSAHGVSSKAPFAYLFTRLLSPLSIITWLGLFFSLYIMVSDFPLNYYQFFILLLFIFKAVVTVIQISTNRLKFPTFNFQSIIVICLALVLTSLLFAFPMTERYLWLLILDRLLFLIVIISLFLILFPSEIIDDLRIREAMRKVKYLKKVKVVYVIGPDAAEIAYFTKQLIHKKKEVIIIQDPFIRPSFAAKMILSQVTEETDFLFIVLPHSHLESISIFIRLAYPAYIILSKFSSRQRGQKNLETLVPFISKNVRLIIDENYEDPDNLLKKKKTYVFGVDSQENESNLAIYSKINVQKKDGLDAKVIIAGDKSDIVTPLIGKHHLDYLLPSILFANLIGITSQEIKDQLAVVIPLHGRLVTHRLQSGVTLIDATSVENRNILQEGLKYLKLYRKERIVIFGLEDELTKEEIRSLKSELAACTTIFVLNEKYQQLVRRLMRVGTDTSEVRTGSKISIITLVQDQLSRGDVVLFIGENASSILDSILLSSSTTR